MKTVTIRELTLINFCNCPSLTAKFDGKSWDVIAENGKGKSRLGNALALLLTTNGLDGVEFEIKPYTADGIGHHQEHMISCTLNIDGKATLELKQIYTEKWSSGRGGKIPALTGHTTTYFVNNVECKTKSEYLEALAINICDEKKLKLITNPSYFVSTLPWKERRAKLIEMAGDISDQDIIKCDTKYRDIPSFIGSRSVDGHKTMVTGRIKEIDEEKKRINAKIEENQGKMPDIFGIDQQKKTRQLNRIETQLEIEKEKKIRIGLGGGVAEKETQLQQVKNEMSKTELAHQRSLQKEIDKVNAEHGDRKHNTNNLKAAVMALEYEIDLKRKTIQRNNAECDKLLKEWTDRDKELIEIENQEFKFEYAGICDKCGQRIPDDVIEQFKKKSLEEFNLARSKNITWLNVKLYEVTSAGTKLRTESAEAQRGIEQNQVKIQELEAKIIELNHKTEETEAIISHLQELKSDLSGNNEYQQLCQQAADIQQQIQDGRSVNNTGEIEVLIEKLETEQAAVKAILDKFTKLTELQDRIKELRGQETNLNKEQERCNKEKDLCSEFTRTKIRMLEERVNNLCPYVRWQMFKEHLNGNDSEEVCIPMGQNNEGTWIPYTALSSGQRLLVGRSMVNTLMKFYDISAPVIADNAEALTLEPEKLGQVISFMALKGQEELKFVEVN